MTGIAERIIIIYDESHTFIVKNICYKKGHIEKYYKKM